MFDINIFNKMNEKEKYDNMLTMLESLVKDELDDISNLCNSVALIKALVDKLNWCGFYLIKDNELVVGPFQGMPACSRIKIGRGVCGTSVKEKRILNVGDVHKFEGHIACDCASNSELVIPIVKENKIYGVLDMDSPEIDRFKEVEVEYLKKCVEILNKYVNWEKVVSFK
ncbi:GAF domain-containing protein [Clostridium sp. WILCCON 0269]|uniref:GAF domain-containing protein n=1 Tax=Candidatus Clostridium eludens TaxID=3381663 RepID=A0ABW8SNC8_9CLOT